MRISLNFLLVYCIFCLTNLVHAQTSVYDNYVGSGGNIGSTAAYFICTGYLTPEQTPFVAILDRYKYHITELQTKNGYAEYCIGPIANGGEAELVLQDIQRNGFRSARLGNPYVQETTRPTAPGQQQNMYNNSPSHTTKPLDQTNMRVYGGMGTGSEKPMSTSATNYPAPIINNNTKGIIFTPPPVHDFNEDRQNEALRQLNINLETRGPGNNATETFSNSTPINRGIQEENLATSPITINRGALLNVYFVQVAALDDANAKLYENLSARYNVYLQRTDQFYKVIAGPFYAKSDAERHRQIIADMGYNKPFLRTEAYFQNYPDIVVDSKTQQQLDMQLVYPKR